MAILTGIHYWIVTHQMNMNILITGTSSGIGLGLALELLKRGETVLGISRRKNKALETSDHFQHLHHTNGSFVD
jgi:NAD(P)-dependent dehydrogenase (short-subunit alcohol dehydrogenase family)